MKPNEEIRAIILKELKGKKADSAEPIFELAQFLYEKYPDHAFVDRTLISMGIGHEELINAEFKPLATGSVIPLVPAMADMLLTPDGEYEANR